MLGVSWQRVTAKVASTLQLDTKRSPLSHQSWAADLADRTTLDEYAFLVDQLIDQATLERSVLTARRWGVDVHEVLIAQGWVPAEAYVAALARHLGATSAATGIPTAIGTARIDGTAGTPWQIAQRIADMERAGQRVNLAPTHKLHDLEPSTRRAWRLRRAVLGLLRWRPALSAGAPTWRWQFAAMLVFVGSAAGAVVADPGVAYRALLVGLSLAFVPIVLLRLLILCAGLPRSLRHPAAQRTPDADLPLYTVLVPMFRESEVLADLVQALRALDYPAAKLDVILVLESIDIDTRRAVATLELPGFMRVVVVPDSQPRTKPKALNYALQFARGAYVVVYDAEDAPDPDQLRLAIAAFRAAPADTYCLQGRLSIDNTQDGWLTRQFALEYAALFDVTLPGLARLGLPIPLGGTSNHFPRAVLDRWTGWDPFNVTEDADLGIRLARSGGRIAILDSTTWEEAPARLGAWLKQRTRWLKGWMQTYLVHTRQPLKLHRELGVWSFAGFHLYCGGLLLSALVFPVFCAMAAIEVWHGNWLMPVASASSTDLVVWYAAIFNLTAAYLTSVIAAAVAAWRRGRPGLIPGTLVMPLYWLLISLAAYRGLIQLAIAPYVWEKTHHRPRRRRFRE